MDTTSPSKSTCKVLFLLLTILPSFNLYKYYWNRSEMLVNVPGITPAMPPPLTPCGAMAEERMITDMAPGLMERFADKSVRIC